VPALSQFIAGVVAGDIGVEVGGIGRPADVGSPSACPSTNSANPVGLGPADRRRLKAGCSGRIFSKASQKTMPGEQFLANLDKGVPPFPPPDVIRDYVKQDCELIRGIGPDLVWSATCATFAASAASGTLLKTPPVARPPAHSRRLVSQHHSAIGLGDCAGALYFTSFLSFSDCERIGQQIRKKARRVIGRDQGNWRGRAGRTTCAWLRLRRERKYVSGTCSEPSAKSPNLCFGCSTASSRNAGVRKGIGNKTKAARYT